MKIYSATRPLWNSNEGHPNVKTLSQTAKMFWSAAQEANPWPCLRRRNCHRRPWKCLGSHAVHAGVRLGNIPRHVRNSHQGQPDHPQVSNDSAETYPCCPLNHGGAVNHSRTRSRHPLPQPSFLRTEWRPPALPLNRFPVSTSRNESIQS